MITSLKQFKKIIENQQPLATDVIDAYNKETFEPIDTDEYEIDSVIDVITDVEEIKKLEENIGVAEMSPKEYKTGSTIWLTVMLKPRNKSMAYNIGEIGVLKARVMQTYYGQHKLKQLQQRGQLLR